MLLYHYTACLEKHMLGRLGLMIDEKGRTLSFSSLENQIREALLPFLLHQYASVIVGSDNTAETGDSYCLKKQINSGINLGLAKSVVDNDDGSHSSIVITNITNTSSEPITLGATALR